MLTTVSPDRVIKGDRLIGLEGQVQWIAAEDAVVYGTDVSVPVQYQPDGGYGIRYWSADTGATFTVERDDDAAALLDAACALATPGFRCPSPCGGEGGCR